MMKLKDKFTLVYKTTTTPFFPICLVGNSYSGKFEELMPLDVEPKEIICLISEGAVNWFFDNELKDAAQKVFAALFSDPKVLEDIKSKEKEYSQKILNELKTPVEELFTQGVLNKKGEQKLRRLFELYQDYTEIVDCPGFLFQVYLTDDFKKEVFSKIQGDKHKKNEVFNYMLSSFRKTNYERFLFAVADLLKNPNQADIQKVADEFYWVIHDYLGDIIDVDYVKKQITEFEKDKETLSMHINGSKERIEKIKDIKKGLSEELLNKTNIIQELLYLYNERKKKVLNQGNVYFRKIVEYKLKDINYDEHRLLYQLPPEEIIKALKGEETSDPKKMNKKSGWMMLNREMKPVQEEYFDLISQQTDVKELKGIPASQGVIKGKANLILNISHIYKFKEGDILVAPYTNINYLPIMAKAKAILTETGGMISHAAIVSREIKKPCIVGIKDLFLVLKDGDKVEVDADKGIVRKIG